MPLFKLLSINSERKAARKTRRSNEEARKRAAISNVLSRRQALAAVRRQDAQITALGIGAGLEGGSAVRNARSNIQAQATAAIANQTQIGEIDQRINKIQQSANKDQNRARTFSSIGNIVDSSIPLPF